MTELSDELLMAYIDGQLDKPQASVVSRLLHHDGALATRVRRMQENQARFLELFGALVRDAAAGTAKPGAARASSGNRPLAESGNVLTASVALLLLVLGASAGFTTAYYSGVSREPAAGEVQMPPANWSEDIAELHAYFTPETLTASRDSQANPEVVKFQLAKLASRPAVLPDFSQHGLKFVRANTLSYRGNKLMQLVYTGKSDPLVAVYVTQGDTNLPLSPGRFGDVKIVSWSDNGLRFLIAADMTQEALRALAAIAQAQLGKG